MRIMILDYMRAADIARVIKSASPSAEVHVYARPDEVAEGKPVGFDFIILHFTNDNVTDGDNAFDFLDGLFKERTDGLPLDSQRKYFNLGARIRSAKRNSVVVVYTGGSFNSGQEKRLHAYGPQVLMRPGAANNSTRISDDLADDFVRALKGGVIDLDVLRHENRSYSFLSALLILCQGYLVAHVNPLTGEPDIEQEEDTQTYDAFIQTLEALTNQKFPDAAQTLSALLPPERQTQEGIDELRKQVREASWWRVVAKKQLTDLVKAEMNLHDAPDSELGELKPLLSLIEEKMPVDDLAVVARAYHTVNSLLGGLMIQL